jgi:hypothetical protein
MDILKIYGHNDNLNDVKIRYNTKFLLINDNNIQKIYNHFDKNKLILLLIAKYTNINKYIPKGLMKHIIDNYLNSITISL